MSITPNIDLSAFSTAQVAFSSTGAGYTYKVPANMALAEGDAVAVEVGAKGLSVGRVISLGGKEVIDPNAKFTYKWVVQRIDRSGYDQILAAEAAARG